MAAAAAAAGMDTTGPEDSTVELLNDDELLSAMDRLVDAPSAGAKRKLPAAFGAPEVGGNDPGEHPGGRRAWLRDGGFVVFPGAIEYPSTAALAETAAAGILARAPAAIGFDVEWPVTYLRGAGQEQVALVQLCESAERCFLFHLTIVGMPESLKAILSSGAIQKVGLNINGDALKMQRDFGLQMEGCVDVEHVAAAKLSARPPAPLVRWSLSALAKAVLGRSLHKPEDVRRGDWRQPLSAAAAEYAAIDAYTGLAIHERLAGMPDLDELYMEAPSAQGAVVAKDGDVVVEAARGFDQSSAMRGAQLAVMWLHQSGKNADEIAADQKLQKTTVVEVLAAGMRMGAAYNWTRLAVSPVYQRIFAEAAELLRERQTPPTVAAVRALRSNMPAVECELCLAHHDRMQAAVAAAAAEREDAVVQTAQPHSPQSVDPLLAELESPKAIEARPAKAARREEEPDLADIIGKARDGASTVAAGAVELAAAAAAARAGSGGDAAREQLRRAVEQLRAGVALLEGAIAGGARVAGQ